MAEESDAGSVREEVRSELANVVLPGQRLRRCGSSSIGTGDEDCGKRETADHCTGHHRLWSEDHELQYFQVWRTDGEALVRVRGSERQPGLEQWRRLAAMYDPLAARRSSGDIRQIFSPTKGTKLEDFSHALQARENLEQRHQERTGDKLPKDMRPAILLAKGVNSTATPVPGLRTSASAYIVTVINTRTRGAAPKAVENWNSEVGDSGPGSDEAMESEDGQLYRLEIKNRTRILAKSQGKGSHKGGGKYGKTDTECFRCGRFGHIRAGLPSQIPRQRRSPKVGSPWQWYWELPR